MPPSPNANPNPPHHPPTEVLIIGGGAAGIGVAASLRRRRPQLDIAIIEPSDAHYYQPAWTLVGGGAFDAGRTVRQTDALIPAGVRRIRASATHIDTETHRVSLDDGRSVRYSQLIVSPGLRLAWERIDGLEAALGQHGVTSNYRFDLAPYTWSLVRSLRSGRALFTQPAMPIKCAGAPQKAMYLACDHWRRAGVLDRIDVEFNLTGTTLFGVEAFVPALMRYVEHYRAGLAFSSTLVAVDGPARTAWFEHKNADGETVRAAKRFDLLHAVPPQVAPAFIAQSGLGDAAGWCEVDPATLQHVRHADVFSLGDACSTPNAKTAAAVRKQAVVVAENLLAHRDRQPLPTRYDGYGGCPLTVERGKVVLAEFGYGGKLLPTFPLAPTVARQSAWWLKTTVLPWLYWNGLLKGREWLARPSLPVER
ncbi:MULTISPECIES: NAD(P)/FAD-dependent oxidoreductase [Ralstonia solanacearum species complex]|uniref:NAD(P)/FAD-dependent oxidoreductase n=1 Tax=Ralstonia solanacearum species complex TaxID=3116862 RepID=UPI00049020B2|nr:FAD/NAD(P)-binding oxidoreductase [Ralstonia pseudosolanacearum]MCK4121126.1 NAD(P)/FAD-dependent oxidoreductase [Ralstonia pseudosolanacearum]MCL1619354.1 NAD(P)/FAD-dependent oxidoreductase [Ralstonia pseudosolanacearum CaRs-Mep]MCQ4680839.1 NAD(P)/FAD-dependent oxidoreductase [Ralstonia pseudosolanacearum]